MNTKAVATVHIDRISPFVRPFLLPPHHPSNSHLDNEVSVCIKTPMQDTLKEKRNRLIRPPQLSLVSE